MRVRCGYSSAVRRELRGTIYACECERARARPGGLAGCGRLAFAIGDRIYLHAREMPFIPSAGLFPLVRPRQSVCANPSAPIRPCQTLHWLAAVASVRSLGR